MAKNNGQPDRDDREELEYGESAAITARLRRDIQAAMNPESGELRSRRAQIMAQIQAETGQDRLKPVRPGETREPLSLNRKRAERPERRGFFAVPAWVGSLAAALVLLLIAGTLVLVMNGGNKSDTTSAPGLANVQRENTAPAAAIASQGNNPGDRAADTNKAAAPAPTVAVASGAGGSEAASSGAAAGGAAPAGTVPPLPTALAAPPAAASAAKSAAATTAAAQAAAASTAAAVGATTVAAGATTAAAATTVAAGAATTAAGATTAAAAAAAGAAQFSQAPALPLYNGSAPLNLTSPAPLRAFLQQQARDNLAAQNLRDLLGLQDTAINGYAFQGSRVPGGRLEDVVEYYQAQASAAGYKVEGVTALQDNAELRVRWLYLSKNTERVGLLVVEVGSSEAASRIAGPGGLLKGDIAVFFATS